MKYLHTGYILFCDQVEHSEDGRVHAHGIFDLFMVKSFPSKMNCAWVIGFGTPFERRQYTGIVTIEDPDGSEVFRQEFQANDPQNIFKGHYIFRPDLQLTKEGLWTAKVVLSSWKDNSVWDLKRPFWTTIEKNGSPDP